MAMDLVTSLAARMEATNCSCCCLQSFFLGCKVLDIQAHGVCMEYGTIACTVRNISFICTYIRTYVSAYIHTYLYIRTHILTHVICTVRKISFVCTYICICIVYTMRIHEYDTIHKMNIYVYIRAFSSRSKSNLTVCLPA